MRSTRRIELRRQALVEIVRIEPFRRRVHEIDDASVSVQETANDREQERVRHIDTTERQALCRREPDREEPSIELDVAERRPITNAAGSSLSGSVADRSTHALEERLDQLCVFGVENEMPAIAGQISIGGGQPYRIRKAIRPDDWSRPMEWSSPATQSIRSADLASPRCSIPRDPWIVACFVTLGPPLALAVRHTLLCADTGRRVKGSVWLTGRSKWFTASRLSSRTSLRRSRSAAADR